MGQFSEATRIYRGLRRRVNNGRPLDSYPFLSGDSYFFSCQYYYKSGRIWEVPSKGGRPQKAKSLFVAVSDLDCFAKFLSHNSMDEFSAFTLVIHNGDSEIQADWLDLFSSNFAKIYAVNLCKVSQKFSPIPIGLENKRYFTNGIPRDFIELISTGLQNFDDRKISFLQAFSHHTNRAERETCSRVSSSLGGFVLDKVSPLEYRNTILNTKYVLSPSGNGIDCHRTWEAMYLGAIPIVRRIHWPFNGENLPVIIIDEWADLLELDFNSLRIPKNETWSQNFWNSFFSN
jgi:hypothetical protein